MHIQEIINYASKVNLTHFTGFYNINYNWGIIISENENNDDNSITVSKSFNNGNTIYGLMAKVNNEITFEENDMNECEFTKEIYSLLFSFNLRFKHKEK